MVKSAGQELRRGKFLGDAIVIRIGSSSRKAFGQLEEVGEGVIQPEAARGAAEKMVVLGEEPPDRAWIGINSRRLVGTRGNAHGFHRDALAVKHAEEVVIRLKEKLGGIGEGFVLGKPAGLGVAVRAKYRQASDRSVQATGDGTRIRIGREETIRMEEGGLRDEGCSGRHGENSCSRSLSIDQLIVDARWRNQDTYPTRSWTMTRE